MIHRVSAGHGLAIGLFLAILGGKFLTIDRFASDLPLWDPWDALAQQIFLPYSQDQLEPTAFLAPHNEHRILWTRLLSFGLLLINGQWDARIECATNAIIHAAFGAAAFAFGRRCLPASRLWLWWLMNFLLIGPPLAWHNVVSGFHSQQYFLVWFSMLTVALLSVAPAGSLRWWLGTLCGLAGLVSMGAGMLAPIAVIPSLLLDGPPREMLRRHWPTLVTALVLAALGWVIRTEYPLHAPLRAGSLTEFFEAFWKYLQWPSGEPWFGIVAWSPWACLAWRLAFRRNTTAPVDRVIVAAGFWAIGIYAASAYARGAGAHGPLPRYVDNLTVGVGTNVLALLRLLPPLRMRNWSSGVLHGLAATGLIVLFAGLLSAVDTVWNDELPSYRTRMDRVEANTRSYVVTGDESWLQDGDQIYPGIETIRHRLNRPELRAILPVSVRPPIAIAGEAQPDRAFVPHGVPFEFRRADATPFRGSFTTRASEGVGTWRSAALGDPAFAYWHMEIASGARSTELSVRLIDDREREVRTIDAQGPALANRWKQTVIPAPGRGARLVASDQSRDSWIAFTPPTEMAAGSWWTIHAVRTGPILLGLGVLLAVTTFPLVLRSSAAKELAPDVSSMETAGP